MRRNFFALLLMVGCCSATGAQSKKKWLDSLEIRYPARYYNPNPCFCMPGLMDSAFRNSPFVYDPKKDNWNPDSLSKWLDRVKLLEDSIFFKEQPPKPKPKTGV